MVANGKTEQIVRKRSVDVLFFDEEYITTQERGQIVMVIGMKVEY